MFKKISFKFKKILAYVICLSAPKSIVEAINVAEDPAELDALIYQSALGS